MTNTPLCCCSNLKNHYSLKKILTLFCFSFLVSAEFGNISYAQDISVTDNDKKPGAISVGGNYFKRDGPPAKKLDPNTGQSPTSNNMLLGSMFGLRPWLAQYGVTFTAVDVNDMWGNPSGGYKQGTTYFGSTTLTLNWDPEKVLGIKNGLFNINALQLRGTSITSNNLGDINTVDNDNASRSTRLWEVWYQQGFFDDKLNIRLGKLGLGSEFNVSEYSTLFLNSNFGWSMMNSVNTYNGGVVYPVASPGIRIKFEPNSHWTNLFAVTDDNPTNVDFCNPSGAFSCGGPPKHTSGVYLNFKTGAFIINELQYHLNPASDGNDKLPGNYKVGGYFDSARFPDQAYNGQGQPLGNPNNPQTMRMHNNNWSIYFMADQMIWRPSKDSNKSIGMFANIQTAPGSKSSISLDGNAGIVYNGIFNNANNSVGFGWGFGSFSNRARQYDKDYRYYADPTWRVRNTEHHIELVAQFEITPWLQLTPDFQYIFNPGGGLNLETGSYKRIQNEAVLGLRSTVNF